MTYLSCPICWMAVSISSVTSSDTSWAEAPGYSVITWASLIVNSGSSRRPIFWNATSPPMHSNAGQDERDDPVLDGRSRRCSWSGGFLRFQQANDRAFAEARGRRPAQYGRPLPARRSPGRFPPPVGQPSRRGARPGRAHSPPRARARHNIARPRRWERHPGELQSRRTPAGAPSVSGLTFSVQAMPGQDAHVLRAGHLEFRRERLRQGVRLHREFLERQIELALGQEVEDHAEPEARV